MGKLLGAFVRVTLLAGKNTGFLGITGLAIARDAVRLRVLILEFWASFFQYFLDLNVQVILCSFPYSTSSCGPLQFPNLRLWISHF